MREIVLEARAVTRTYGTGTGATHALRGVDVELSLIHISEPTRPY